MRVDAVLIAGPTASGKSALAVALAQEVDGTVINADSMQIYGEARILTARPPEADTARVPHLLFSHVSVNEPYSAGRYQAEAAHALSVARNAGRVPIFTGGTGLYFSALLDGLAEIPPVPAGVRAQVRARREAIGAEAFHNELTTRDPQTAAKLRASDTQRTLRAYEVFEATGRPLIAWQSEKGTPVLEGLRLARFVISPERSELHTRIEQRFDAMLAAGAVEEAVLLAGVDPALPAAKILGRRELLAAANGEITLDEAKSRAKAATRQYAKRQMTWFRHRMADWEWPDLADHSKIIPEILSHIT